MVEHFPKVLASEEKVTTIIITIIIIMIMIIVIIHSMNWAVLVWRVLCFKYGLSLPERCGVADDLVRLLPALRSLSFPRVQRSSSPVSGLLQLSARQCKQQWVER